MVLIWYSRHLAPASYGNYQHFWIQLNVLYPLACIGVHALIVAYSPAMVVGLFRSLRQKHFLLYGLWVLVLAAVFASLQLGIGDIGIIVPLLFLIAYSLTFILESFLIVCRSYKVLLVTNILFAIAFWSIHAYALKQVFSLSTLFGCLLLLIATRFIIYLVATVGNVKRCSAGESTESLSPVDIRTFWLHIGFYDVSQVLFSWIDKFIISLVLAAQLSAVYFIGSQNIPFLPLLLSAAGSAVLMQTSIGRQKEDADIAQLMNQLGRILSCIVFPLFFFLLFFRAELIVALFTDKYIAAIPVFLAATFVLPLRAYSFTTVLQRLHMGKIINAGAIGDLLIACGLMYPLYRWLGLPGVALSFVISTYLQSAFYLYWSAKKLNVSPSILVPYGNWLTKLIVFASVFIVIHYVGEHYFAPKFMLFLGGSAMVVLIGSSLLLELSKQKKHGGS